MTREKKEQYLYDYCSNKTCSDCILNEHEWEHISKVYECLNFNDASDNELDKAIELILNTTHDIEEVEKISKLYKSIKLIQESEELDKAHNTDKLVDVVNHPSHYTDGKIEVIDYIEDKKLNFNLGNAIKYISRAGKKDKSKEVEDLEKAVFYINREINRLKGAC
jgi:hypothetical protein